MSEENEKSFKEKLLDKIKEKLKEDGKEHLLEFAEDFAFLSWDIVKFAAEISDNKIDDIIVGTLDKLAQRYIDDINKSDNE